MLQMTDVHTYYGESHILQGMGLRVESGECVALLGPNGMGKTTTLRTIMGLTPARSGSVLFKGREIAQLRPFQVARLGIGYVPEDRGLFADLTVVENLKVPFLNLKAAELPAPGKKSRAASTPCFPSSASAGIRWPALFRGRTADAGHGPGADLRGRDGPSG